LSPRLAQGRRAGDRRPRDDAPGARRLRPASEPRAVADHRRRGSPATGVTMAEAPETRYTKSGDTHIAYQVIGNGPLDVVWVPGFVSHVEHQWQNPRFAHMLQRLASFSRLIMFDKPGTGMSDRLASVPTLEQRMDDVRAVMDAVGSERAAFIGVS